MKAETFKTIERVKIPFSDKTVKYFTSQRVIERMISEALRAYMEDLDDEEAALLGVANGGISFDFERYYDQLAEAVMEAIFSIINAKAVEVDFIIPEGIKEVPCCFYDKERVEKTEQGYEVLADLVYNEAAYYLFKHYAEGENFNEILKNFLASRGVDEEVVFSEAIWEEPYLETIK